MLKIQTHIKNHGLKKTLDKFRLNSKDLGHKVMLKYSQLNSPLQHVEVHEARGLVLDSLSFDVISMPFQRFFAHNDHLAPKLDLSNTVYTEKRDGTLIQVYYDYKSDEWCVNTMFSQCEEDLYFAGQPSGRSFKTLFMELMEEYGCSFNDFMLKHTFIFELTSQYNKVVVRYAKPELRLIGVRDLKTLKEYNFSELCAISKHIKIPIVETYQFSSIEDCVDSFNGKSFNFEGYVAWDGSNRVKIKNPAYVAVHLTKKGMTDLLDLTKPYIFLDVVKQNEIEEFKSSFPHTKSMIEKLDKDYKSLVTKLVEANKDIMPPVNITAPEKKKFAENIFTVLKKHNLNPALSSLFFLLHEGRVSTIEDYIRVYDNKKLYKLL